MTVMAEIRQHLETLPPSALLTAKSVLHLGSRAAVDQSLARLSKSGLIVRVARGAYSRPVRGRFGGQIVPEAHEIAQQLAEARGERVMPHGAVAINRFRLSTQVPLKPVFLTTGRSKTVKFGWQTVRFQHVAASKIPAPNTLAGLAVTALHYLRQNNEDTLEHTNRIVAELPLEERARLAGLMPRLPGWMIRLLSQTAVLRG